MNVVKRKLRKRIRRRRNNESENDHKDNVNVASNHRLPSARESSSSSADEQLDKRFSNDVNVLQSDDDDDVSDDNDLVRE